MSRDRKSSKLVLRAGSVGHCPYDRCESACVSQFAVLLAVRRQLWVVKMEMSGTSRPIIDTFTASSLLIELIQLVFRFCTEFEDLPVGLFCAFPVQVAVTHVYSPLPGTAKLFPALDLN